MLIRADGVTAAWESPHQHTHTNTHRVHHQELNPPASAKENRQASVSKRDTAKYRQLRFDLTLSRHSTQHPAPDGGVVFCAGILPHRRRRQIRNAHLLLASRVETLRGGGRDRQTQPSRRPTTSNIWTRSRSIIQCSCCQDDHEDG